MTNKLLVTFNTCGISGKENIDHYVKTIHQLLSQDFDNYRVVLSSCLNNQETRDKIYNEFGGQISYNYIDDVLPIVVTFNDTVLQSVKHHGYFEGYLYVESGLDFEDNDQILKQLYNRMKSGPYSIVSGMVDTDAGYEEHNLNIANKEGFVVIPVGKAVNGHIHIFSDLLVSYYGRGWPDIFAGYCNESVFSFLSAALQTKWVLSTESTVKHYEEMDGRSSGFNIPKMAMTRPTWDHPFIIPSITQRICTEECWNAGLGYEEFRQIMMHRQDQFDEQGFCINDKLKEICKTKLFLQPDEFDYDKINHRYIK